MLYSFNSGLSTVGGVGGIEVVTNLLVKDFLSPYATEALSVLLASSFVTVTVTSIVPSS